MSEINFKLCEIEKKVLDFFRKNINIIIILIITILAFLVRKYCINFISGDYVECLSIWFDKIKSIGNISALKEQIGNYNETYMWVLYFLTLLPIDSLISIKLISILFDFIGAFVTSGLVYVLTKENKNRIIFVVFTYIIILFSPNIVLNSSVWGQCDFIYTSFAIISLILLIREKYALSFIIFGISFAFKLQAIFLLPVFILIYISRRKFPIYYFIIPIIINIIVCIPSMIIGKSFLKCMSVYFNQSQAYNKYLTMNFPNIYYLFNLPKEWNCVLINNSMDFSKIGIIITLVIFISIFYVILKKNIYLSNKHILSLSLWSVLVCTCFLPHMHDRYMFIADILSIVYFIVYKKRIYVPLVVNFISFSTYIRYLFGNFFVSSEILSFINVIFIILFTIVIFKNIINTSQNNNILDKKKKEMS